MSNFLKAKIEILKKKNFFYPELELRILLNKFSISTEEIILSNFKENQININQFEKAFKRRSNFEPISKIFNEKYFWKYKFFVNKDVLDPRPESELIIQRVLQYFPDMNQKLKILDIGTGSGCLAISLAKEYKKSMITATDISKAALMIAKNNSIKLLCDNQINFAHCNLIKDIEKYDIVVSNPPYLSNIEYNNTSNEIQLFEPKIAFIGGKSGLKFYKEISFFLDKILNLHSFAFLEIGAHQAKDVIKIFRENNIKLLELVNDIQGLDRMLILKKNLD